MLKIKDNVDLKELEKFGIVDSTEDWLMGKTVGVKKLTLTPILEIEICINHAKKYDAIKNVIYTDVNYIPNIIYDLIKADLVEKVEEE